MCQTCSLGKCISQSAKQADTVIYCQIKATLGGEQVHSDNVSMSPIREITAVPFLSHTLSPSVGCSSSVRIVPVELRDALVSEMLSFRDKRTGQDSSTPMQCCCRDAALDPSTVLMIQIRAEGSSDSKYCDMPL